VGCEEVSRERESGEQDVIRAVGDVRKYHSGGKRGKGVSRVRSELGGET